MDVIILGSIESLLVTWSSC